MMKEVLPMKRILSLLLTLVLVLTLEAAAPAPKVPAVLPASVTPTAT